LGNETKRITDDDEYYRLRYDAVVAYPGLKRQMGKYHSLKIGPAYSFINVEQTPGRFITSDAGSFYLPETEPTHFLGGKLEYEFVNIDDSVLTFRGIKFLASAITQEALGSDTSYTTTELESRLSIFVPIANRSVLALRVGGATRVGDYAFYHANTLGGFNVKRENGNLRGHLRGRYAGRTSLYFNNDLRIKLFTFRTYLFPAHFGVVGFYDIARVWVDHEESSVWHNGYGAGIWIDPFAWTVFNLNYAASKEEKLITLTMGFLF
jgi:hypothetical protein